MGVQSAEGTVSSESAVSAEGTVSSENTVSAGNTVSAEGTGPYEVIHLGGEAAAIVPLAELRRLRAVERHAPAEVLESAEIEAALASHDDWARAGRPGARPHDEVMTELLSAGFAGP
jgi:hypothetical protein